MGVYNRLMKMPEHCKYCEWVRVDWDNIHFDGNGTVYCAPLFEPIPNGGRHKDCPLVEVKVPHGDLISRSEMHELINSTLRKPPFSRIKVDWFIETARTVIEAEVE